MSKLFTKVVSLASVSIFILTGFAGMASAQSEWLFDQSHFYTAIFRGDGEAIVYAKLAIANPDEKPLTEFSFEIPKVSPSKIVMYQMKFPQECVRYNDNDSDPAVPCLEYGDPDPAKYYDGYAFAGAEYKKIQYTQSGNLYHLTLPETS